MSYLEVEAERLRSALMSTPLGERFNELYAAQAALAYAQNPQMYEAPSKMIERFNKAEGSKGCPSECDQAVCE